MQDIDTFLTTLYVMVDTFCQEQRPEKARQGPQPSLSRSEVLTLCLFSQWRIFDGERSFYRYAKAHLRPYFPTLPTRPQLNRLMRGQQEAIVWFFRHLAQLLKVGESPYEALDTSAVVVRHYKRRGHGHLAGYADLGWSNRLGFYEGFHLLVSVTPQGVITGFGFGAASEKDQKLAETFLAVRHRPHRALCSVGEKAAGPYVADTGFEGLDRHKHWKTAYDACLICRPKRNSRHPWPKYWRRFIASIRQIIETVYDKLHHTFGLDRERPHQLDGFHTRLAAKIALHNFCIWINQLYGRPNLAFADLIQW